MSILLGRQVEPEALDGVMDFDHVILVHPNMTITEPRDVWAPEVADGELYGYPEWRLLTGYTGQHGYNGPTMHVSEFIGGGMARSILERPGYYVVVVDSVLDCDECIDERGEPIEDPECQCDHEPAGWCVAYKPYPTTSA